MRTGKHILLTIFLLTVMASTTGCLISLNRSPARNPALASRIYGDRSPGFVWIEDIEGCTSEDACQEAIYGLANPLAQSSVVITNPCDEDVLHNPTLISTQNGFFIAWEEKNRDNQYIKGMFLNGEDFSRNSPLMNISGDHYTPKRYSYDTCYSRILKKVLVVWSAKEYGSTNNKILYRRFINAENRNIDTDELVTPLEGTRDNAMYPRIATDDSRRNPSFFITWIDGSPCSSSSLRNRVRGAFLRGDLTGNFTFEEPFDITGLYDYRRVAVVYDSFNRKYLVVYDNWRGEIRGRFIGITGEMGNDFPICERRLDRGCIKQWEPCETSCKWSNDLPLMLAVKAGHLIGILHVDTRGTDFGGDSVPLDFEPTGESPSVYMLAYHGFEDIDIEVSSYGEEGRRNISQSRAVLYSQIIEQDGNVQPQVRIGESGRVSDGRGEIDRWGESFCVVFECPKFIHYDYGRSYILTEDDILFTGSL